MSTQRSIVSRVTGQPTSDGAGVRLNRVIGGQSLPELDPFLLLDEFLSDNPDDYIAGFPDHPHRGFETATYMLAGRMRHGDNQGNSGVLEAGSVQWMTAGRGIVHSEMPEQEDGLMWGFQLWINLPASDKLCPPRYQDIAPQNVPEVVTENNNLVRVVAGSFHNVTGPVTAVAAEPVYLDIHLGQPDQAIEIPLPVDHNAFCYCYAGSVVAGTNQQALEQHQLGVLSSGDKLTINARQAQSRCLVVAGRPFNEPVARYGPFVMNTNEEIKQAIRDLQSGRF